MADSNAIYQPKSSREEAAAAERSKREAELAAMAALRRPRVEQQPEQGGSTQTAAAEAARRKRDAEIEELRRLKAADNEETRRRLQEKGGQGLTTDMDAWRSEQLGAKDRDRKNKADARNKLTEHHAVDSDAAWRAEQMEAKERDRRSKLEAQNMLKGHRGYYEAKKTGAGGAASGQAQNDTVAGVEHLSLGEDDEDNVENAPMKEERVVGKLSLDKWNEATPPPEVLPTPTPTPVNANLEENVVEEEKKEVAVVEEQPISSPPPPPKAQIVLPRGPPTYTRFDIKFSFGLIVRSSAAAEEFGKNEENLRDNETLRKCMESTSKILMEQMPAPPDSSGTTTTVTEEQYNHFPDAYYDPRLEPTVISIEEDEKPAATTSGEDEDIAKGNKRTLVKASFPVFLRDENADDEMGKKECARMLKETKNTVFKSLRAAVSGGSFLKL